MNSVQWNPWHGCHKCSPGCANCFVYYLDAMRGRDAGVVTRSKTNFHLPLKKDRSGNYKIPSGSLVATCFSSDFFLEEADAWRSEAWELIRQRPDVTFLICTKRIARFNQCLPAGWNDGYDNVVVTVTCEAQEKAGERLPVFLSIRAKHKQIFVAPILEYVDLSKFLDKGKIDLVSVGGESYQNARVCDFEWVKKIKETCDRYNVNFTFYQTGNNFVMDGKRYTISHKQEYSQARKAMKYLEGLSPSAGGR